MGSKTFKGLIAAIGLLWFTVILGGVLATPPAPATAIVSKTNSDPARAHRLQAAGLMVIRIGDLNKRMIAQCKRAERLAPPNCTGITPKLKTLVEGVLIASEDEAQFMKFVDLVQQLERELTPILQRLDILTPPVP